MVILSHDIQAADPTQNGGSVGEASQTPLSTWRVDFTSGPLTQTDRPLDVALHGDGFFSVEGTDGPLYTRNGVFFRSDAGELVTADGLPEGSIDEKPDALALAKT